MHISKSPSKPNHSHRFTSLVILISSLCLIYLLVSLLLLRAKPDPARFAAGSAFGQRTELRHIAFGIASSAGSWPARKELVATWWDPDRMRGCVFVDEAGPEPAGAGNDTSLPPLCVSEDTSRFRYTYRGGDRSAIRVARVVAETVARNFSGVRWFVFGDDDTVFFPDNLARTLSKYDHELCYYVGTNSEIYEQISYFGSGMAFGGAGFAVSYPLAKLLEKALDSCIQRYPHVYGSDSRISSCVAELGYGLTREPGFHQIDLRGDLFGLLATHPVTPLVSLHHLDHIDPIFPNKSSPKQALQHLLKSAKADPLRLLHQSVCYDKWFGWTVVVSWGYAVQIHPNHVQLPDLLYVPETFRKWTKRDTPLSGIYTFTTRPLHPEPCRRPTLFFMDRVMTSEVGQIETTYQRSFVNCSYDANSPRKIEEVRVFSHKLDLGIKELQAPRRQCCDVLPSNVGNILDIRIRECNHQELIHMH